MTFTELKKKDIICIGDGRLLGRVTDLVFDPAGGQITALIVSASSGLSCIFRGEKNQMEIAWRHIACIGDDVILKRLLLNMPLLKNGCLRFEKNRL